MTTPNRELMRRGIEEAINRACGENDSNTPDWILAGFLMECFDAFTLATQERERWYGVPLTSEKPPQVGASCEINTPADVLPKKE